MKILLIGRRGQLAWELQQLLNEDALLVLGSNDFDITNEKECIEKVVACQPEVIINAAAYTSVDLAEHELENAYNINELGVVNLMKAAKSIDSLLVHVSTDFVFDGSASIPYAPEAVTCPLSVYGKSKCAGEKILLEHYTDRSVIVRTSWVYSSHGNNFVKTMLRLMAAKERLSVVTNQIGSPTYARELARFIYTIVHIKEISGVFHWTDSGAISWYDFALEIQSLGIKHGLLKKVIPINKILSLDYPTTAKRPQYSVLDTEKSLKYLESKKWQHNLEACISILGQDSRDSNK